MVQVQAVLSGRAAEVAEQLAEAPLFEGMPREVLLDVAAQARRETFAPGEVVILQGQPGERCYVVIRGRVGVTYTPDPQSIPVRLAVLRTGDFFGEMALLDGLPCSATVTVLASTETISLGRQALVAALRRHPDSALHMLAILCRRLRATEALLDGVRSLLLRSRPGAGADEADWALEPAHPGGSGHATCP